MTRQKPTTAKGIADTLRSQIASGELRPGEKLPSTRQLCDAFTASEPVVYRAVTQLKETGLVVARQGLGVFVRVYDPLQWNPSVFERGQRRDDPTTNQDDWEAQVVAQGRVPEQSVPEVAVEPAPEDIARWLNLEPLADVVVRRRLRSVDGEPAQIADSWFPLHIAEGTPLMEPRKVAMRGGILASIGRPQHRLRDELTIRMPTADEILRLQLEDLPGTPVCQHVRTGFDAAGEAIRVMVTVAPGDRNTIVYEMEVNP